MTVQEINQVHQRYIALSNTFRAAWTFHQFLEGLRKVFPEDGLEAYEADFQAVYRNLKAISDNLNELGAEMAAGQLTDVETELAPLVAQLSDSDSAVSPGRLRQFFERVRNYDDGILQQLVKFYLSLHRDDGAWPIDRLDKADFLVTRLSEEHEESSDSYVLRDPGYVRELTTGLWQVLDDSRVTAVEVASACEDIESIRHEIAAIDSIESLADLGLVQRYREIKHALGSAFFHPKLLRTVLEANLALKNRVQRLYAREEQRIVAEYQQVFDLERDVPHDTNLRDELASFRSAVEHFEAQLQRSNVRLEQLADVRRRVRELLPRLRAADDTGFFAVPATDHGVVETESLQSGFDETREVYDRMIEALANTAQTTDPKKVTLEPEVFGFGLEPREVLAFRRLSDPGQDCDHSFERHLLDAAALRTRMLETVDAIKSIWDDTAFTKEGPLFDSARRLLRIGDRMVRRFQHRVEQVMMSGDLEEARTRKILEMRLVRVYSGLWLMVHRS